MVIYFSRCLIASTMTTFFAVAMEFLRKYMPMYLICLCAKGAAYTYDKMQNIISLNVAYLLVNVQLFFGQLDSFTRSI